MLAEKKSHFEMPLEGRERPTEKNTTAYAYGFFSDRARGGPAICGNLPKFFVRDGSKIRRCGHREEFDKGSGTWIPLPADNFTRNIL